MTKKVVNIYIIPTLHWDREWFLPYQQMRKRFVSIMDKIIEVLKNNDVIETFMLDGQTILIEDYLEIKPQMMNDIIDLVSNGKLLIGPYYIGSDEFLVSGESLIENLKLGYIESQKYGGIMKIGYLPDAPGHIAQLPQILVNSGLEALVFHRGMKESLLSNEFIWRAADKSSVIAVFLPQSFNILNTRKIKNDSDAKNEIHSIIKKFLPKSSAHALLIPYNLLDPVEQMQKGLKFISKYNKGNLKIFQSNIQNYINEIKKKRIKLKSVSGELRGSTRSLIHPGVLSIRPHLKIQNRKIENMLINWVERFSTINYLLTSKYPFEYINLSWKKLLLNQNQDSIGGCCVDNVIQDIEHRSKEIIEICNDLIDETLTSICNNIDDIHSDYEKSVVVFNPLSWERTEIVEFMIDFLPNEAPKDFEFVDEKNVSVPYKIIEVKENIFCEYIDSTLPEYKKTIRYTFIFLATAVPPVGYKTYKLIFNTKNYKLLRRENTIKILENSIENEYFKVSIDSSGVLQILDIKDNIRYNNQLIFEDGGDVGDEYNYAPPLNDIKYYSCGFPFSYSIIDNNPCAATLILKNFMKIPVSSNKLTRSAELTDCQLTTYITLKYNQRRIDIRTEVINKAENHRLRVCFHFDETIKHHFVEQPFCVLKRDNAFNKENQLETEGTGLPQQNFVFISKKKKGICYINKGLYEYAILNDNKTTIVAITLFRAIGWLSLRDLSTRRGKIGPELPVPYAQSKELHQFEYSIFPYKDIAKISPIYQEAYNFNIPCIAKIKRNTSTNLNAIKLSFVKIFPKSLVITRIYKSQFDDGICLRFFNLENKTVRGKIEFFKKFNEYKIVNNLENPISHMAKYVHKLNPNTLTIIAKPKQIITLKIYF